MITAEILNSVFNSQQSIPGAEVVISTLEQFATGNIQVHPSCTSFESERAVVAVPMLVRGLEDLDLVVIAYRDKAIPKARLKVMNISMEGFRWSSLKDLIGDYSGDDYYPPYIKAVVEVSCGLMGQGEERHLLFNVGREEEYRPDISIEKIEVVYGDVLDRVGYEVSRRWQRYNVAIYQAYGHTFFRIPIVE